MEPERDYELHSLISSGNFSDSLAPFTSSSSLPVPPPSNTTKVPLDSSYLTSTLNNDQQYQKLNTLNFTLSSSHPIPPSSMSIPSPYLVPLSLPYPSLPPEPKLLLPSLPSLDLLPPPNPPKRPPPPGYDMKTLRKQLEYLSEEIKERVSSQFDYVSQNKVLFSSLNNLLEMNQYNNIVINNYIKDLLGEVGKLYKEKFQLTNKLNLMNNNNHYYLNLLKELKIVQMNSVDLLSIKKCAEEEILSSSKENSGLEDELLLKLKEIKQDEDLIHYYNNKEHEKQSIEIAINYYNNNRNKILLSSYNKFKKNLVNSLELKKINSRLSKVNDRLLLRHCFSVLRHEFKLNTKVNQFKKNSHHKLLAQSFQKMISHCNKERFLEKKSNFIVLNRFYRKWKNFYKISKKKKNDDELVYYYQNRKLIRECYNNWKKSVILLGWNTKQTQRKEKIAIKFYLKKLFFAWSDSALKSKAVLIENLHSLQTLLLKNRFSLWKEISVKRWKKQGKLIKKFFFTLRQRLLDKQDRTLYHYKILCYYFNYKKRLYIRRWRDFTKKKIYYKLKNFRKYNKKLIKFSSSLSDFSPSYTSSLHNISIFPSTLNTDDKFFQYLASSSKILTNSMSIKAKKNYFLHSGSVNFLESKHNDQSKSFSTPSSSLVSLKHSPYYYRNLSKFFNEFFYRVLQLKKNKVLSSYIYNSYYKKKVCKKFFFSLLFKIINRKKISTKINNFLLKKNFKLFICHIRKLIQYKIVVKLEKKVNLNSEKLVNKLLHQFFAYNLDIVQKKKAVIRRYKSYLKKKFFNFIKNSFLKILRSNLSRKVLLEKKLKEKNLLLKTSIDELRVFNVNIKKSNKDLQENKSFYVNEYNLKKKLIVDYHIQLEGLKKNLTDLRNENNELKSQTVLFENEKSNYQNLYNNLLVNEKVTFNNLVKKKELINNKLNHIKINSINIENNFILEKNNLSTNLSNINSSILEKKSSLNSLRNKQKKLKNSVSLQQKILKNEDEEIITEEELSDDEYLDMSLISTKNIVKDDEDDNEILKLKHLELDSYDEELLLKELSQVSTKIKKIKEEKEIIDEENDKKKRRILSELQVLKNDSSLSQARVNSLYQILNYYDSTKENIKLNDVYINETTEINDLNNLKKNFQQNVYDFYANTLNSLDSNDKIDDNIGELKENHSYDVDLDFNSLDLNSVNPITPAPSEKLSPLSSPLPSSLASSSLSPYSIALREIEKLSL